MNNRLSAIRIATACGLLTVCLVSFAQATNDGLHSVRSVAPASVRGVGLRPDPAPVLSVLEAATMMGHTVSIEGTIAFGTESSAGSGGQDGSRNGRTVRVRDETGSVLLRIPAANLPLLKEGGFVRVTGRMTAADGKAELVPESVGILHPNRR